MTNWKNDRVIVTKRGNEVTEIELNDRKIVLTADQAETVRRALSRHG
jgi:hypothetical protein